VRAPGHQRASAAWQARAGPPASTPALAGQVTHRSARPDLRHPLAALALAALTLAALALAALTLTALALAALALAALTLAALTLAALALAALPAARPGRAAAASSTSIRTLTRRRPPAGSACGC